MRLVQVVSGQVLEMQWSTRGWLWWGNEMNLCTAFSKLTAQITKMMVRRKLQTVNNIQIIQKLYCRRCVLYHITNDIHSTFKSHKVPQIIQTTNTQNITIYLFSVTSSLLQKHKPHTHTRSSKSTRLMQIKQAKRPSNHTRQPCRCTQAHTAQWQATLAHTFRCEQVRATRRSNLTQ